MDKKNEQDLTSKANSSCSNVSVEYNRDCYPELNKLKIKVPKRSFGGKTEFVIDWSSPEATNKSKIERHFHQRMLRAYLKGKEYFYFGTEYNPLTKRYKPKQHKVLVNFE